MLFDQGTSLSKSSFCLSPILKIIFSLCNWVVCRETIWNRLNVLFPRNFPLNNVCIHWWFLRESIITLRLQNGISPSPNLIIPSTSVSQHTLVNKRFLLMSLFLAIMWSFLHFLIQCVPIHYVLSLFYLVLKLSRIWPGAHLRVSSYVILAWLSIFEHFLAFWHNIMFKAHFVLS